MHIRGLRRLTVIAAFTTAATAGAYSINHLPSLTLPKKPDIDSHLIVDNEEAIAMGFFGKSKLEGEELTVWMNDRDNWNAPVPMPGGISAKFNFASREICLSGKAGCHSMETLDRVQVARLTSRVCEIATKDNNQDFIKLHCP